MVQEEDVHTDCTSTSHISPTTPVDLSLTPAILARAPAALQVWTFVDADRPWLGTVSTRRPTSTTTIRRSRASTLTRAL
eukprot:365412-Chlamydomonas_euryale.AAC.22